MAKICLISVIALFASVAADPYVFSPYYASAYSAYAPLQTYPASLAAYTMPVDAPAIPAAVPAAVPAAIPAAVQATYPISTVSAYSYGSGYSMQELPVVAPSAPLVYSSAYTRLPYAYDYFYRK